MKSWEADYEKIRNVQGYTATMEHGISDALGSFSTVFYGQGEIYM